MTQIVVLDPQSVNTFTSSGGYIGIDISAYTDPGDYISVALPAFPRTKVDIARTYLDLTSNPTGDFAAGPTDSIAFDQASPALSGSDGDVELRLPISLFTNIDKTNVTGVRFRVQATANCTFKAMAIRACAGSWEYAPVDLNTLYNRVERTPSPDGDPAATPSFPTTADPGVPSDFPIVWRSGLEPSAADPRPINSKLGITFTSGSFNEATAGGFNEIGFYFREIGVNERTMSDLDGMSMADLEAAEGQPDFGVTSGSVADSWIKVVLHWDDADATLAIKNADDDGYDFDSITINPDTHYWMLIEVVDESVRVQIYPTDEVGNIDGTNLVFDSTLITDPGVFKRRRGRVGWYAHLADGDAALNSIRPRNFNFGEIKTTKASSNIPVEGISLVAGTTADKELVTGVVSGPWGGSVNADVTISTKAYKVVNPGIEPMQGLATNWFWLDDLDNTQIVFDIKFPSAALTTPGGALEFFLYGEYQRLVPLNLPELQGDRWERIRIPLADQLIQTGLHRLVLVQSLPQSETTWWVDNLSVTSKMVEWYGRSVSDGDWMPLRSVVSTEQGGVVFPERGQDLQIKATAYRHNAEIHDFQYMPKYAELGRFVWADEIPVIGSPPPTHTIGVVYSGRNVTLTATLGDPFYDNSIIAYAWSFGDGTFEYGPVVTHTYARSGTYTAVLTVVGKDLASSVVTQVVTV